MDLDKFLSLVNLIAETIKPMQGMTGSENCDTCTSGNIGDAITILKAINIAFTISPKTPINERVNNAQRRQTKTQS